MAKPNEMKDKEEEYFALKFFYPVVKVFRSDMKRDKPC